MDGTDLAELSTVMIKITDEHQCFRQDLTYDPFVCSVNACL
jgi:hypothetical protein